MTPPGTIGDALALARSLGVQRLDAQLLVGHHCARSRTSVIAHGDAALTAAQANGIARDLQRRAAGEPLAYLLGTRDFHGLELQVSPAVLVPRQDTETLVDWAIELLRARGGDAARVIDLGTGSGAIALAVKHSCPGNEMLALDASGEALAVARANAQRLSLDVAFRAGDWWTGLGGERFDLVLSNPPYIAEADPHLAALAHEPQQALTSGADGLDAIRRIVHDAPQHMNARAWLLLEHGHEQGPAVRDLLHARGFAGIATRRDLEGRERTSGAFWPTNGTSV